MRKKICLICNKIVNENHKCKEKKKKKENKETYKLINNTRWRKLRKDILQRDNFECQRCLIKYGIHNYHNLQVDHIKPRIKYPELAYDKNNLITLCATCNNSKGTNEELDFEPRTLNKETIEYKI